MRRILSPSLPATWGDRFRSENGRLSAASGCHDDNIIATAICYQMLLKLKRKTFLSDNLEKMIFVGKRREMLPPSRGELEF
jgi:hypothetical protein